jgi:hypothetical protein
VTRVRRLVEVYCPCGSLAAELPAPVDPSVVLLCLGCSALGPFAQGATR